MIRSGIGTDPEVLRHHPLAQRVAGAECRDQFSRPFSSRENYFLLTFPLIEPQGGFVCLGPRTIWIKYPLVNGPPRKPLINPADRYADYWRREQVCRLLTSNNLGL